MPRTGHSRPPHHHPNTCANSIGDTVPMRDKSTPQGPVHRSSGTLASAPEGARGYRMVTAPVLDYSRWDRMLATQAATSLLLQVLVWLALFHLGFALVLQAFDRVGWPHALAQAGSSLLTLGYSAFNRRETEVTLLGGRAGTQAWGPAILARTRDDDGSDDGAVLND